MKIVVTVDKPNSDNIASVAIKNRIAEKLSGKAIILGNMMLGGLEIQGN